MALTLIDKNNNRYREELYHGFFFTTVAESINPGNTYWSLRSIRLHCSAAFISVEPLKIYISSALGPAHNFILYSANFSGVTDFLLTFSDELPLLSNDHVVVGLSNSGTNTIGMIADVWAARG